MEKLTRRSDSAAETPSGHLAVVPLVKSGIDGAIAWFEFKAHMLAEVIRLEWPHVSPVVVVEADIAKALVRLGYAGPVSDELLADYNDAVDKYNADNGISPEATVSIMPPTQPPNNVQLTSGALAPATPDLVTLQAPRSTSVVQPLAPAAEPDLMSTTASTTLETPSQPAPLTQTVPAPAPEIIQEAPAPVVAPVAPAAPAAPLPLLDLNAPPPTPVG